MAADKKTMEEVLKAVPQQSPFRFIDEILELNDEYIVGAYRFRENEFFYQGHFPDHPITPGVILIETMAQTGVVAFGIYLLMKQNVLNKQTGKMITLFTLADDIEFAGIVSPGERVIIRGEKVYFRRGNLKTRVGMQRENGQIVCSGILAGMGSNFNAE
ncbi:MAG: beta-hydroxyacyl-ACP dehydratase [Syntrophales bacterium]|nr:beta-hydroxyacyl-ACP dehydratase [Syntrophales bacterium]